EFAQMAQALLQAGAGANALSSSLQSLINLRDELTSGASSGLTPAQQLAALQSKSNTALAAARSPYANDNSYAALSTAGGNLIQAEQQAYGNSKTTADVRSQILSSVNDVLHAHGFASGGVTTPGWIRVGERGPEWMLQSGGNTVLPNGMSPPSSDAIVG